VKFLEVPADDEIVSAKNSESVAVDGKTTVKNITHDMIVTEN
jgi:hypothetical protein